MIFHVRTSSIRIAISHLDFLGSPSLLSCPKTVANLRPQNLLYMVFTEKSQAKKAFFLYPAFISATSSIKYICVQHNSLCCQTKKQFFILLGGFLCYHSCLMCTKPVCNFYLHSSIYRFCYILTKIQPEDATHFLSGFYSTRRSFTHRHKLLAKQKRKAAVPAFLCYNIHKSKRLTQCIYIYHEQDSTMLHNNKKMLIFLYSHKETLFVACYP